MKIQLTPRSAGPLGSRIGVPVSACCLALLLAGGVMPSAWSQAPSAASRSMPPPATPVVPGRAAVAPAAQAPASPVAQPAPGSGARRVQLVDSIVAVVNNEVITQNELEDRVRLVERRMKSQNVAMPPLPELRKQLLERLIVDRAQLQLAKESGIRVDDISLDRAVSRIAEQNKVSIQDFRNQIERDGTPFARFREEIRDDIIMQRLREREVDNKIQITESEVDNYLSDGKGSTAAQGAQTEVNLAQILIRIPENASSEQIEQRRSRAEEALKQLQGGGDFAKVAATFSDASDGFKGGELGWRTQDRLPQLFVDASAGKNPGELATVKSANGFHILKVLGRRAATASPQNANAPAVQQTRARHILIRVNQVVSSTDARRKLAELKERLNNKAATFEELARLYSNDNTASRGGDLGWVYPGDTVPEFERAMNALQPGQVSEPIESPFGFHLIQVVERKTDDVSKERQRMAARQVLRERKLEEATEDWMRQLRDRAYVEYRQEDLAAVR